MMQQHDKTGFEWTLAGAPLRLREALPQRLRARPGRLQVHSGRVWITRAHDTDDHVLGPGESLAVDATRDVLVEAWHPAQPAVLAWRPEPVGSQAQRTIAAPALALLLAAALGLVTSGIARLERLRVGLERWRAGTACGAGVIAAPGATGR
jgi:hypothetical protein